MASSSVRGHLFVDAPDISSCNLMQNEWESENIFGLSSACSSVSSPSNDGHDSDVFLTSPTASTAPENKISAECDWWAPQGAISKQREKRTSHLTRLSDKVRNRLVCLAEQHNWQKAFKRKGGHKQAPSFDECIGKLIDFYDAQEQAAGKPLSLKDLRSEEVAAAPTSEQTQVAIVTEFLNAGSVSRVVSRLRDICNPDIVLTSTSGTQMFQATGLQQVTEWHMKFPIIIVQQKVKSVASAGDSAFASVSWVGKHLKSGQIVECDDAVHKFEFKGGKISQHFFSWSIRVRRAPPTMAPMAPVVPNLSLSVPTPAMSRSLAMANDMLASVVSRELPVPRRTSPIDPSIDTQELLWQLLRSDDA